MTFDQIEFFMSCASCLNFSLAAKYHFVSVSTLSRSISALEEELGVKLFERGYHGHKLTEAGKDYFDLSMRSMIDYNSFICSHGRMYDDAVLIGCYPFNGSFARLINCFSNAPSDFLGKKFRVCFIPEGRMLQALDNQNIHVAVDTSSVSENDHNIGAFYADGENCYSFISKKDFDYAVFRKVCQIGSYYK